MQPLSYRDVVADLLERLRNEVQSRGMNKKLQVIATMVAKASKAAELRQLLEPAVPQFRAESGCEGYILLEDKKHSGRFVTYETWKDEAALKAHMSSPALKALEPQLKELLEGPLEQELLTVLVAS